MSARPNKIIAISYEFDPIESGQDARTTCGAGILGRRLFLSRSCIA